MHRRGVWGVLSALRQPGVRWIVGFHGADLAVEYASSIALMVLVYDRTGSPIAAAAMLLAKQVVPGFLAVALGRLLEPVEPRAGLSLAYAARGTAFLLLAAAGPGAIYALAFVAGLAGTASRVFIRATVARATAGPQFRAVSALQNVVFGVMALAGPAAGAAAPHSSVLVHRCVRGRSRRSCCRGWRGRCRSRCATGASAPPPVLPSRMPAHRAPSRIVAPFHQPGSSPSRASSS